MRDEEVDLGRLDRAIEKKKLYISHRDHGRYWNLNGTHLSRTRVLRGIPEMKATNFLLLVCLTPKCQSATYPGGARALSKPIHDDQLRRLAVD